MKTLLLLILLTTGCSLQTFNKTTLVLSNASIACDAGQTMEGLHEGLKEQNHLLGSQPSTGELVIYNGTIATLNTLVYTRMPNRAKWIIPLAILLFQSKVIADNSQRLDKPLCGLK